MHDENSTTGIPRNKSRGKPFLRTQRLVAPRMVAKTVFRFDDSTREKLRGLLLPSRRGRVDRPATLEADVLRQLDTSLDSGAERREAALDVSAAIAGTFTRRRAQGWNEPPAPREETRRALVRVGRLLAEMDETPDRGEAPLMAEIPSGSELEARLLRAGWPIRWAYWLPKHARPLRPGVAAALKALRCESRDDGRPVDWAERQAYYSLATVWWWATGRPVSLWLDVDGKRRCPFDEFAREVFAAVARAEGHDGRPPRRRHLAKLLRGPALTLRSR